VDILDNFVHYRTDTAPGSSGSPVFNDQWEIVALHHSGVPKKDSQGRILAKDGSVWNSGMGQDQIQWTANEGIRISKILKHVQGLPLTGAQVGLRKQMLDSQKGWTAPRAGELISEGIEADREARSWTLPLQLTIDVGQGASAMLAGGAVPRIEAGSATPAGNGGEQAAPAQDELVAAWRAFQSSGRPTESSAAAPSPTQAAAAPVRAESALEWLTGQSRHPSTMEEQFAQNGAASIGG
jgi:hypothetical protein